ncbi:glycosyltransferase, partial [Dubosiella newyorkensis]
MNVGIFTDSYLPDINGVVTSIVTLKKALEQLGHTVFIVSNHIGTRILYDPEERILRLPGVELKHLYGYTMSSPLNFAREYLEEMDLDIIHTQHEFGVSLYGRMMGKELNIPVVYTYHTMYED